jgi:hypothetical protein
MSTDRTWQPYGWQSELFHTGDVSTTPFMLRLTSPQGVELVLRFRKLVWELKDMQFPTALVYQIPGYAIVVARSWADFTPFAWLVQEGLDMVRVMPVAYESRQAATYKIKRGHPVASIPSGTAVVSITDFLSEVDEGVLFRGHPEATPAVLTQTLCAAYEALRSAYPGRNHLRTIMTHKHAAQAFRYHIREILACGFRVRVRLKSGISFYVEEAHYSSGDTSMVWLKGGEVDDSGYIEETLDEIHVETV